MVKLNGMKRNMTPKGYNVKVFVGLVVKAVYICVQVGPFTLSFSIVYFYFTFTICILSLRFRFVRLGYYY